MVTVSCISKLQLQCQQLKRTLLLKVKMSDIWWLAVPDITAANSNDYLCLDSTGMSTHLWWPGSYHWKSIDEPRANPNYESTHSDFVYNPDMQLHCNIAMMAGNNPYDNEVIHRATNIQQRMIAVSTRSNPTIRMKPTQKSCENVNVKLPSIYWNCLSRTHPWCWPDGHQSGFPKRTSAKCKMVWKL